MNYFNDNHYLVRRKILKLVGGAFHIYDRNDQVVAYSKLKAFKLKEDIRMYTGEDMQQELFRIHARNIIDTNANQVNRFLTMAGAVLLCAIEGKQD